MPPGDSGGGERRYGYGVKTVGECSLGTLVGENGGMDTEIRQWVSAAWGHWWKRTEVWIRR